MIVKGIYLVTQVKKLEVTLLGTTISKRQLLYTMVMSRMKQKNTMIERLSPPHFRALLWLLSTHGSTVTCTFLPL